MLSNTENVALSHAPRFGRRDSHVEDENESAPASDCSRPLASLGMHGFAWGVEVIEHAARCLMAAAALPLDTHGI